MTEKTLKLYRVTCRGMQTSVTGPAYGVSYALAGDPTRAYEKVRKYLDDQDIGFAADRELEKIELVAEATDYPNCGAQLHL